MNMKKRAVGVIATISFTLCLASFMGLAFEEEALFSEDTWRWVGKFGLALFFASLLFKSHCDNELSLGPKLTGWVFMAWYCWLAFY